ncbi:hypothetical protein WJX74_008580 [Apatococcus lobatus]|uniref:Uncharacterized protein n=1 Tax=Apatococcus lobatus TaxID=904363 RepID=A0AAW1Q518_9CHLO
MQPELGPGKPSLGTVFRALLVGGIALASKGAAVAKGAGGFSTLAKGAAALAAAGGVAVAASGSNESDQQLSRQEQTSHRPQQPLAYNQPAKRS